MRRRRTTSSESLVDTPVHKIQASAATLARSQSLDKTKSAKIEWLRGYEGDGSAPGDLLDSSRHKVQAAAAKMVRSHSLEALCRDGTAPSVSKSKAAMIKPRIPRPCFEFEEFSDSEAKEEDIDELVDAVAPTSPSKRTFWDSAWRMLTRPVSVMRHEFQVVSRFFFEALTHTTDHPFQFKKYESMPAIVAVRGRVRSSSDTSSPTRPCNACCPPCEHFGLKEHSELSCDELLCCGAFDLKPEKNLTCEESHEKRVESLKDPACLVGYQICLLRPEELPTRNEHADTVEQFEIDGVDEELVSLSERLRCVIAYQKEYDRRLLKRSSKYLLMKSDGSVDWFELKRGLKKRGLPFTTLRRVCE